MSDNDTGTSNNPNESDTSGGNDEANQGNNSNDEANQNAPTLDDINAIKSDRDRNYSRAEQAEKSASEANAKIDSLQSRIERDDSAEAFLEENADDYPDVSIKDLKAFAATADDVEAVAKRLQAKAADIRDAALANARIDEDGLSLTPEEAREKLDEIDEADPRAFEKAVDIEMRTSKRSN